jgi:hypothetical protein
MELEIDPDVKAVIELMQSSMAAAKLVPVAEAVAALAPILWGRYETEDVTVLRLRSGAISVCDPRKQSASSESSLER